LGQLEAGRHSSKDAADPRAAISPRQLSRRLLSRADASRENLRMGDVVEVVLRQVMTALVTNDRPGADARPP